MIDLFHGNPANITAKRAANTANGVRIRTTGVMVVMPGGSKPKRNIRVCP